MSDRREEEYDYEQEQLEVESMSLNWAGNLEDYDDGGFATWEGFVILGKVIR